MKSVIGIIGAGAVASNYYIPALKRLGYHQIYIHDINKEQAKNVADKFQIRTIGFDELNIKCGTIIITAPPNVHEDLLMKCIHTDKIIVCEKPFLLNAEVAQNIIASAEAKNCKIFVGHIRRLFGAINLAKQYIQNSLNGSLVSAKLYEGGVFHYKSISGYVINHPMGGVLPDTGSHVLDALLYVTGIQVSDVKIINRYREKEEPCHEWKGDFEINKIPVHMYLSRYETLANLMQLQYTNCTLIVPIGLKSNMTILHQNGMVEHVNDNGPVINYMTEAFYMELDAILNHQAGIFDAKQFLGLTKVLEKLYYA